MRPLTRRDDHIYRWAIRRNRIADFTALGGVHGADDAQLQDLLISFAPVATERAAALLLSVLEGASLVAWALKDGATMEPAFEQAVSSIKA